MRRVAAAMVGLGVLTACTSVQQGSGTTAPGAVDTVRAAQFDALYAGAVLSFLDTPPDTRTSTFTLATYGEKKVALGDDVVRVGSPPSIAVTSRATNTGQNLDIVHVAGDPLDYMLLGDTFRSLSPTPWVSFPSYYGTADAPVDSCDLPGMLEICGLTDAIQRTIDDDLGDFVREVTANPDGSSTLTTAVTLSSFLSTQLVGFTDEMAATFSADDQRALLPVIIVVAPDGKLTQLEVNGTLPATDARPAVALQVGLTVDPEAPSADDIPALPSAFDTTALPDRAASDDLYRQITLLRPQANP